MKKCMGILGGIALLSLVVGAVCMKEKKTKKCGVRHAAARLMDGVNDFLDDLGVL